MTHNSEFVAYTISDHVLGICKWKDLFKGNYEAQEISFEKDQKEGFGLIRDFTLEKKGYSVIWKDGHVKLVDMVEPKLLVEPGVTAWFCMTKADYHASRFQCLFHKRVSNKRCATSR